MLDATPLLRLYARARLSALHRQDPAAVQQRTLQRLIVRARDTKFAQDHALSGVRTVTDYQRAVPLRTYDAFWHDYWSSSFPLLEDVTWPGRMPFFARSSGTTTGRTKHIPVSHEMVKSNQRAAMDLLVHHVANRPASRVLAGRNFLLGSSISLDELAEGVRAGDLSGIAAAHVPRWAHSRFFPSGELAAIQDWERKTDLLARESVAANIRSIAGTPSWLLLFFDKLSRLSGRGESRLATFYPDLEMVSHGGVSFAPYATRFRELLEDSHAETREVYPASEGFFGVADRGPGEGLRMEIDNGLFYEFVPVEELDRPQATRHWAATAQPGVNYALVMTSCAGLWSYVVGDTIRLVTLNPLRLLVTGRTSYSLSAFGEHLIGEEVDRAITAAAEAAGTHLSDFSVGPVLDADGSGRGHHTYVVEFDKMLGGERLTLFGATLDSELHRLNADYADHRRGDFNLCAPEIVQVEPGTFARWMKERGKLGAQHKVPRLVNDAATFRSLLDWLKT